MKITQKIQTVAVLLPYYLMQLKPVHAVGLENGEIVVDTTDRNMFTNFFTGDDAWNKIFDMVRVLISGITGILTIVMVGIFAFKAFELAKSGNNPSERQKAIQGLIYSIVGFALLGSASLFTGVFYNLLK